MDLNQLINTHYEKLNETDLVIWRYICTHIQAYREWTMHSLAKGCSTSETVVSRFCKKLGFEGFSELKILLKWQEVDRRNPSFELLSRVYQDYFLTLDTLQRFNFSPLFGFFDRPGKVFLYGTGTAQRRAAAELKRLFAGIGKPLFLLRNAAELELIAGQPPEEGSALIVFSLSGNNAAVNPVVRRLREQGFAIIAVTSYEDNALAKLSDAHLYYYNHRIPIGCGPEEDTSLCAPFFLISEILFIRYVESRSRR